MTNTHPACKKAPLRGRREVGADGDAYGLVARGPEARVVPHVARCRDGGRTGPSAATEGWERDIVFAAQTASRAIGWGGPLRSSTDFDRFCP